MIYTKCHGIFLQGIADTYILHIKTFLKYNNYEIKMEQFLFTIVSETDNK